MITTQPCQINTQYNTQITLSHPINILSDKLLLLSKDLEKAQLYPIDCVVLTPTQIHCLCKSEVWGSIALLSKITLIINRYNKYLNTFDLRLTSYDLKQDYAKFLITHINDTSKDIFTNSYQHSMGTLFGEAQYEDTPEWFRNGIWITPSSTKSKP